MFGAGPGGFGNAPVTKVIWAASLSSSVLLQAARAARRPVPAYVAAFEHIFVFRHPGELLVGAGLLYYSRLFERQMGSAKYGGFVLGTGVLSLLLELVAAAVLHVSLPSGPYGLIFANFVTFALTVPPMQRFSLFGRQLTDKVFLYMAGAQLFFSAPQATLIASLCGAVAGVCYHSNFLGLKRLKLPKAANDFLGRTLGPLLGTRRRRVVMPPEEAQQRAAAAAGRRPAPRSRQAQAVVLPEASPDALAQLVAMGFDSTQAALALRRSQNDVQSALATLLG